MKRLWCDTETFNEVSLKKAGAYKYAETVETIIVSWAWNEDPVHVWDLSDPATRPGLLLRLQGMIDDADDVVAHNSPFDRVTLAAQGVVIPVEKITDTMVLALQHSLPAALDMLCEVLGVPQDKAKDKEGKKLIQLFCKPRPKNVKLRRATRETHPQEWLAFCEYARLDVESMREVYKRIPRWNDTPAERELWLLDQQTNDRGFRVDLELATAALRAFDRTSEVLAAETLELTGGAVGSATQRARLKEHLEDEHGFSMADMTKGTVEKVLRDKNLSSDVRVLLENRQQAAATSPAKYQVLLLAAGADGRLRGTLQFCGAGRTFRDSGRLWQPQNLMRTPDWFDEDTQESTILAFKLDCEDVLYANVTERVTFASRGSMIAEDGEKLVIADLSNIEGRMLAWLAGEAWKIEAFKAYDRGEGADIYKITAGRILGKPPERVTKDERQKIGKVYELSAGFGGSLGAARRMGGEALDGMDDDQILANVRRWRDEHPATRRFWYALERAARAALESPGSSFSVRGITFDVKKIPQYGQTWLRMRKPNGHYLLYLNAQIERFECPRCGGDKVIDFVFEGESRKLTCPECNGSGEVGNSQITYEGLDQYTRQWKRLETYYGRLVENLVQSVARDVFMSGFRRAMAAGYPVVLRVHDELVAEVPDTPEHSAGQLAGLMAQNDSWNLGLPLAAAGFECKRYRKG